MNRSIVRLARALLPSFITEPAFRLYARLGTAIVPDHVFLKRRYHRETGLKLDLAHPKRFNDKLAWLLLHYRNNLLPVCSDKVTVRDYVSNLGLAEILHPIHGVYDSVDQVPFEDLPAEVFIRTTHGSGHNIIYRQGDDLEAIKRLLRNALRENYYWRSREWNYKDITPRIMVEPVLQQEGGLVDYRVLCFNGRARLVYVDIGTASPDGRHSAGARRNVYSTDFELLDITVKRPRFEAGLANKPENFDTMLEYAEKLAEPFPFCRVDFYNIEGRIVFGEITFFPGGARQTIEPDSWDFKIATWLELPTVGPGNVKPD